MRLQDMGMVVYDGMVVLCHPQIMADMQLSAGQSVDDHQITVIVERHRFLATNELEAMQARAEGRLQ